MLKNQTKPKEILGVSRLLRKADCCYSWLYSKLIVNPVNSNAFSVCWSNGYYDVRLLHGNGISFSLKCYNCKELVLKLYMMKIVNEELYFELLAACEL